MDLNIKALLDLFKSTNTSYKFLYFYALIKIIKKNKLKKKISFDEILSEMLLIAWLPSFQFNLNFRKQDKTKNLLSDLFRQFPSFIKENKPTNKIISQIHSAINRILDEQENSEILEQKFLRYVMVRLIRPFYKRLKNIPESGKLNMFRTAKKILIKDYKKEQPPYLIDFDNREIILNRKWSRYIENHFLFLELWVLNEWHGYMQYQNRNSPSLYNKLKFPEFQRSSLDKQRKFWKQIIKQENIKCIFSGEKLTENNFDIDHFICWNFLAHDQEWNLIPVLSEINRSKNNKIPNSSFVEPFVNFKIQSFKSAKLILTPKKYEEYLAEHSNFINFSLDQCFTPSFKIKYIEEINSLANKAKNQNFELFNGR